MIDKPNDTSDTIHTFTVSANRLPIVTFCKPTQSNAAFQLLNPTLVPCAEFGFWESVST